LEFSLGSWIKVATTIMDFIKETNLYHLV